MDCLKLIREWSQGQARVRCSTRPDALESAWLDSLRGHGLSLVEVGVQSFDDAALHTVKRGYTGAVALEGCRRIRAAGMACGIQLMPGMPGVEPETFLRDVAIALAEGVACLRFYPCLVLEGTRLAEWWRAGLYAPWDLATTVQTLGRALAMAWAAGVPVIRMGLAPGQDMENAVLAGPWHPALGSLAQAEALAWTVEQHVVDAAGYGRPVSLHLPKACQGFMGGRHASVWERLARVGLSREAVLWHDATHGSLLFQ